MASSQVYFDSAFYYENLQAPLLFPGYPKPPEHFPLVINGEEVLAEDKFKIYYVVPKGTPVPLLSDLPSQLEHERIDGFEQRSTTTTKAKRVDLTTCQPRDKEELQRQEDFNKFKADVAKFFGDKLEEMGMDPNNVENTGPRWSPEMIESMRQDLRVVREQFRKWTEAKRTE